MNRTSKNRIEIEINERKKILINLLAEFDHFCSANSLRYSIWYGTAIGAIRHKGFIPWDDDIDVVMPREDYDLLLKNYCNNKRFKLFSDNEKDYKIQFAKLCDNLTYCKSDNSDDKFGVFLDIFPVDLSSEILVNEKKLLKIQNLLRICNMKVKLVPVFPNYKAETKFVFLKKMKWILYYFVLPFRKFFTSYKKQKYLYEKIIHLNKGNDLYKDFYENTSNNQISRDFFDNFIRVSFENIVVSISTEYDKNLRSKYGNYMELPPENERRCHSYYHFYYK